MKLIQSIVVMFATMLFSYNSFAGVFKCTDIQGNTTYQSIPCAEENKAVEIDVKTGGSTDMATKLKDKELDQLEQQQQLAEQQKLIELETKRKKDAKEQSTINQQLIKNNPVQFSAYAIPPYAPDKLPALVKLYEQRLPEIEKFRRLAAQKALATGNCIRVEDDQLSIKSTQEKLVFSVDCSSAKVFHFDESELVN